GNITQIEYYKTNTAAARTKPTKVYMRSITGTTITSTAAWNSTTYTGGLTALYNANTTQDNTVGWKAIPVSYSYTSGNLLVMVNDTYGGSGGSQYMAQETVSSLQTHKRQDGTDPGDATAMITSSERTTIRITYSSASDPCSAATTMQCGVSYTANLSSPGGQWNSYNGTSFSYPGTEQVWSFTAPTTGSYTFHVNEGTADADFFFMSACSPTSTNLSSGYWSAVSGGTSHTISLTAGITYYLIADLYSSSASTTVTVSVDCPGGGPLGNCPVYSNTVSSSNDHCSNQIYYLEVLNTNCEGEMSFDVVGNYGSSYASEITWSVTSNLTTNILASGGPGTNGANIFTSVGPIDVNVQGSAFTITVYDSYGDGFASGGFISIQQSGVDISTPITGNFGAQSHSMFMPNIVISPAIINVTTPSGNVSQTVVNCNDFRVPLTINNSFFCSTSSVNLPWEITCQATGTVISSGTHTMTIYPNTPSDISDIVEISFDADNCEWITNWQNDCALSDLGSLFDITPDPTAAVDACIAHSPQTFTLQYNGINGGLACCNTAGPSLPMNYAMSTSAASVVSSPFGGTNNSAYLTIPANASGGNATALNLTFNMSGYCFVHPNYDATDFWITIMIDGSVVHDEMFSDPTTSANISINLAYIPGGYNQNSVIVVYVYPNTFSSGTTNTTFIPGVTCGSLYSGQWTAGSFNLSVDVTFDELAPSPITCQYTDNINKPCCTVYPVLDDADEICSGASFDVATWQDLVNNSNTGACIVFSSIVPIGGSVAPDGVFPNGINGTLGTIAQTVSAYAYCDSNGNGSVDAGDTYTVLSTYSLTINPILTPNFTQLGPYCVGDTPETLPTTSLNGVEGTWLPATISTAVDGTISFTFTPLTGSCAIATTMTITINPNITPAFTPIGPYCEGDIIPDLPLTSTNGITGIWSPAINNSTTTTYTFTPTSGGCTTTTTQTIVVEPNITPTFAAVGPYLIGTSIPSLPTTSTNGITGTWAPAVNNTATTTYTFTPTAGQCATTATLTIIINIEIHPVFNAIGPFCSGEIIPPLPMTSTNGINGTWLPAINNTATTTYTFTPAPGQNAVEATMIITIIPTPNVNVVGKNPLCSGDSNGSIIITINNAPPEYIINWGTNSITIPGSTYTISNLTGGNYSLTVTSSNNCSATKQIVLSQPERPLSVTIASRGISCHGESDGSLSSNVIGGTSPYTYFWRSGQFTSTSANFNNLSAGEYSLLVTDANGCTANGTATIVEPTGIEPTIAYGNPSCIGNNDGYIELTVVGGASPYLYVWNSGQPHVSYLHGLKEGTYIVTITDANQCVYELNPIVLKDIKVDCITIPSAFTPNGDNVNDTWVIGNIDMFPGANSYVFNRWGQPLYHATGLDDPWDGTYNGKFVPSGTYLYVINLFNGTEPYTGTVSVVY
ncbi:MAG: gliding motility-associated C-terminal domain-containing protein, partial [Bacteroidales bacterium]|nr:gliding motility-associated C-terminal domain-containing protein [Bacteroidales bacterium]